MRILVVEDSVDLAHSIATSLRQMEHAVDTIGDGISASAMLKTEPYDLVVLDLNLPGRDGLAGRDFGDRSVKHSSGEE